MSGGPDDLDGTVWGALCKNLEGCAVDSSVSEISARLLRVRDDDSSCGLTHGEGDCRFLRLQWVVVWYSETGVVVFLHDYNSGRGLNPGVCGSIRVGSVGFVSVSPRNGSRSGLSSRRVVHRVHVAR